MDNNFFGENINRLRREAGMSQEELAEKLGVTSQAVSKWECALSLPDISLILPLADLFGVSADGLLRGEKKAFCEAENVSADLPFPDDGKLRVVQFLGSRLLRSDEANGMEPIKLLLDDTERNVNVEITGNADIEGDVGGDVNAGNNAVVEGDVDGDVKAGNNVAVEGDVDGDVNAGNNATVEGDVGGDVNAG